MTLGEVINVMSAPDLVQILKGETEIYHGYLANIQYTPGYEQYKELEVAKLTNHLDIKHKRYKELGLENLETSFKCLWDEIRGKETPCYLKEEATPLKMADLALNLACEAVQTAAMLMKYEMSLNPGAESEGE